MNEWVYLHAARGCSSYEIFIIINTYHSFTHASANGVTAKRELLYVVSPLLSFILLFCFLLFKSAGYKKKRFCYCVKAEEIRTHFFAYSQSQEA
jgi:hypothetical protein